MKPLQTGRREFLNKSLKTIVSAGLVGSVMSCSDKGEKTIRSTNPVVSPKISVELNEWIRKVNEYSKDLKTEKLSAQQWQQNLEQLYSRISLDEIVSAVDLSKWKKTLKLPEFGVVTEKVRIKDDEELLVLAKVFGMSEGRAIIPHGHSNMASCHYILSGNARLRQYDKIEKNRDALIIKPTIDSGIKPGDFSSISDEKNNVHWFVATSGPLYALDIIVLNLKASKYEIHNIDIENSVERGGLLEAPLIGVEKALNKYGRISRET